MSYESPIKWYQADPFVETLRDEADNVIVRAVAHADVQVDRDELIKALEYDRGQYEKGFHDGRMYTPPGVTNADRIRAMTDEELAGYLSNICYGLWKMFSDNPEKVWLDWLKSPVEVEE